MNNRELINYLEQYPDDYIVLITTKGYDNINIVIEDNIIIIDGYFNPESFIDKDKHNKALKRADKVYKKIKFQRRLNNDY